MPLVGDITDPARLQQELEFERERLRLLLDVHKALVADLDLRILFKALAARLRRVTEPEKDERTGQPFSSRSTRECYRIGAEHYLVPVNADIPALDAIYVEEHDPHVNPLRIGRTSGRRRRPGYRERRLPRDWQAGARPPHHTGEAAMRQVDPEQ